MFDPFDIIFALMRTGNDDLTARQIALLRAIQTTGKDVDRQVSVLARALKLSKPVVSRCADRLEVGGYITRGELKGDRRACVLAITRKGRKLLADIAGPTAVVA